MTNKNPHGICTVRVLIARLNMSIATNRTRAAWHLKKLGWSIAPGRKLTQAIKDFQRGYTHTVSGVGVSLL